MSKRRWMPTTLAFVVLSGCVAEENAPAPLAPGGPDRAGAVSEGGGAPPSASRKGEPDRSIFADTNILWPDPANIPVCWESPGHEEDKATVRDAVAASWSAANPRIQFKGWGSCGPASTGIRIRIDSRQSSGPYSLLGAQAQPGTTMVLAFDLVEQVITEPRFQTFFAPCLPSTSARTSCIEAMAVHEFGHALGIMHEQDRSSTPPPCDRDQPFTSHPGVVFGAYDPESVMNYCKPNRLLVGRTLSPLDRDGVRALYGENGPDGGVADPGRTGP